MAHIPGHIEPTTTTTTVPGAVGNISGNTTYVYPNTTGADAYASFLTPEEASAYRPLGNNFLREYEIATEITDPGKGPLFNMVKAEEFLTSDEYQSERRTILGTGQAYKYVYFPTDIGAQARQQSPYMITQTKNVLARAGFLDLNKTQGSEIDDEYLKGIKSAMEFSMNTGGQMSWVAAAKVMAGVTQGQAVKAQGVYTFGDEQMNDFVKEMLKKAKARKGAPLSSYETQFISNALMSGPVAEFEQSLQGLSTGTEPQLQWVGNAVQGQAVYTPGTEAQTPDETILTEGGQDVLDEVFEPREELQRQADMEDETFMRMQRNLAGLKAAEQTPVMRRG